MNRAHGTVTAYLILLSLLSGGEPAFAAPKVHHHHNGHQLLGEKLKNAGHHVIHEKGEFTVSVAVENNKVRGVHVKHAKNGDVTVKKYKTDKKMAFGLPAGIEYASLVLAQAQQLVGSTYIGYAYTDDLGNEEIYWFPYDMILDGDTGAITYVPAG